MDFWMTKMHLKIDEEKRQNQLRISLFFNFSVFDDLLFWYLDDQDTIENESNDDLNNT